MNTANRNMSTIKGTDLMSGMCGSKPMVACVACLCMKEASGCAATASFSTKLDLPSTWCSKTFGTCPERSKIRTMRIPRALALSSSSQASNTTGAGFAAEISAWPTSLPPCMPNCKLPFWNFSVHICGRRMVFVSALRDMWRASTAASSPPESMVALLEALASSEGRLPCEVGSKLPSTAPALGFDNSGGIDDSVSEWTSTFPSETFDLDASDLSPKSLSTWSDRVPTLPVGGFVGSGPCADSTFG
mmetsp:Transcript_560/g.1493  ORF Transcript_560/g.1493 Transcript_560/m.1493 type:complete len:246 (-) Transcript_560:881-1618(-)